MLSPQEAYRVLKDEHPSVVCTHMDAAFPDREYYWFYDTRPENSFTQCAYLVNKESGEILVLDDFLKIITRESIAYDSLSDPDNYFDHRKDYQQIVNLVQPGEDSK